MPSRNYPTFGDSIIKYLEDGYVHIPQIGEKMSMFIKKNKKKIMDSAVAGDKTEIVNALRNF